MIICHKQIRLRRTEFPRVLGGMTIFHKGFIIHIFKLLIFYDLYLLKSRIIFPIFEDINTFVAYLLTFAGYIYLIRRETNTIIGTEQHCVTTENTITEGIETVYKIPIKALPKNQNNP